MHAIAAEAAAIVVVGYRNSVRRCTRDRAETACSSSGSSSTLSSRSSNSTLARSNMNSSSSSRSSSRSSNVPAEPPPMTRTSNSSFFIFAIISSLDGGKYAGGPLGKPGGRLPPKTLPKALLPGGAPSIPFILSVNVLVIGPRKTPVGPRFSGSNQEAPPPEAPPKGGAPNELSFAVM